MDWTLGLKCDHRFWPWPWPWPWIFKVKCGIRYISVKNGPIATRRKANILIDLKTSNVTIGFDLGHDLDPEFSRSNMELAISLPKMVRLPQNEKQTHRLNSWPQMWPSDLTLAVTLTLNFQGEIWIFIYLNKNWPDCHETKSKHIDLNSRPQIWPLGLTLAMTLIFEFWRSYVILTIWWPRSGVRIYQIVTGVTSDVGVPSTHLVLDANGSVHEKFLWIIRQYVWWFWTNHISVYVLTKSFLDDQAICLMILDKSSDILQNHQHCLMGQWLFVNTAMAWWFSTRLSATTMLTNT